MIKILDMPQGSPEWYQARLGLPTASEFGCVMAKGKGLVRRGYMMRLAAELITGEVQEKFSNQRMRKGKELEGEARDLYAFLYDVEPRLVGLVRNDIAGCSPDALIGDYGMIEIKTREPPLMIDLLSQGGVPSEHKPQIQGSLWVTGREWCDFIAYWPGLPLHVCWVERDEDYIAELAAEVEKFAAELDRVVRQVGLSPRAALQQMLESSL
jgi:hypothetical protein